MGEQRRSNYALSPMTRTEFIDIVTDGQPAAPGYFGHDAALNRKARALLDERPLPSMDLAAVDAAGRSGAVVVDVRPASDFAAGHLAGSLGIALDGRFAEQTGSVVDPDTPIVIAGDVDAVEEARVRLARIGYDRVVGAVTNVEAALAAQPDRARRLSRLTASAFLERRAALGDGIVVVDVRTPGEVADAPL
jgi:rhodanese-related sulfurtransferase